MLANVPSSPPTLVYDREHTGPTHELLPWRVENPERAFVPCHNKKAAYVIDVDYTYSGDRFTIYMNIVY